MSLEIVSANRLDDLAECFIGRISAAPLPPMEIEQVLVQSRGMARWLNLRLAERCKIASGIQYLFPNTFIDRLLRVMHPAAGEAFLDRGDLLWQIASFLEKDELDPAIRRYVRTSSLHRLQLASTLADLFDQYTVYRSDMLAAWEAGREDHWQARLWRALRAPDRPAAGRIHRGQILAWLREGGWEENPPGGLPPRLSIFGVSSLPPFHLEVLAAVARNCRVSFYLLNPCREFWDDIADRRRVARLTDGFRIDPAELYLEGHNSLLSSLGGQGAEFFRLLRAHDPLEEEFFRPYEDGDGHDPLRVVQRDILDNVDDAAPVRLAADDLADTITFHDCSSRMREVEVLREELFALFADDPGLEAAEVAVMVPDIALYAPLIDAVFGDGREPAIPYAIADRPLLSGQGPAAAFMELLELGRRRYRFGAVVSLFEKEVVRRSFSLSEEEVSVFFSWLEDAGVRWGLDREQRRDCGLPPMAENSWQWGIDRLLMGYATGPVDGCATVCGIAPLVQLGGDEAELAGRAIQGVEAIFSFCREFASPASLGAWSDRLGRALDSCISPGPEEEDEYNRLRELVSSLSMAAERTGFAVELSLDEMIGFLSREMAADRRTGGFLSGGLTFCELLPMRSIPFKVICLLGMDYESFPRRDRLSSIDLIAANPRPGDRSRRSDDRYLFLEVLISATERLYLSFVGRDASSNSERPPSVLLSELADYLDRRFLFSDGGRASESLTRRHPVSSWSRGAFDPARPVSFSLDDLECARLLDENTFPKSLAGQGPLAEVDLPGELTVVELADFFSNPARYFCRRVLEISLPEVESGHDDLEPFEIAGLPGHELDRRISAVLARGGDGGECYERARAEGIIPHGPAGEILFRDRLAGLRLIHERMMELAPAGPSVLVPVDITVMGTRIRGELSLFGDGLLVRTRRGAVRGRELLCAWIELLCLGACDRAGGAVLIGLEGDRPVVSRLAMPDDPQGRLRELLAIFRRGLGQALPFFPEAAKEFVESMLKGKTWEYSLGKAAGRYRPDWGWGEADDPWVSFVFQDDDPIGPDFAGLAQKIFLPVLEAAKNE